MGSFNIYASQKAAAKENNYKLDLFETVSSSDKADMSVIKRYFNNLYDGTQSNLNTFSVNQNFQRSLFSIAN